MTEARQLLIDNKDEKYAEFQAKLTPTVSRNNFIGVRVPVVRKIAKEYIKNPECEDFLNELPHEFYDENMLHGALLCEIKDYEKCVAEVERFLPFIDNWAVCDTISPKVFKKHKEELLVKIKEWCASKETYTARFGIEMLMSFYLDQDFKPEYLELPKASEEDDYYRKMMVAWFFATALAKQWDATIPYIERKTMAPFVHNKTIQKAIESFRVSDEHKTYLRTLKK